jgi:DNA-binding NarL/FixJ family response regulator
MRRPPILERLLRDPEVDERLSSLTEEERVLDLIAEGLTDGATGEPLRLAVKNDVTRVFSKMGQARRSEATVCAVRPLPSEAGRPTDGLGSLGHT